jgi:hypothetical protein
MRFSNAEIAMFFADHNPPHFHVRAKWNELSGS